MPTEAGEGGDALKELPDADRADRVGRVCGKERGGVEGVRGGGGGAARRGWCLGGEQFRQELLAQVDRQLGALHFGPERAESQEARAERQVQEELQRLGWKETDLAARRKGDPAKVRLAQRLRQETPMTLAWIALRLQMGIVAYLNSRLYLLRKDRVK
jgi:hypothetical protein